MSQDYISIKKRFHRIFQKKFWGCRQFGPSSARIKNLILQKLTGAPKKPFQTRQPFWDPLAVILDFAGVAGSEGVPPLMQGWYFLTFFSPKLY